MRGTEAASQNTPSETSSPVSTATPTPVTTTGIIPEKASSSESKMAAGSESKMAASSECASVGGAGGPTASQSAEGSGRSEERDPPLRHPGRQGDINAIATGGTALSRATEERSEKRDEERPPGKSRTSRETGTMTSPEREAPAWGGRGTEVGVQASVEVCDRETNTGPLLLEPDTHTASHTLANGLPATAAHSALTGLPSCHSSLSSNQETGTGDKAFSPPLICVPIGQPPFQHVCQIDIELCSQSEVRNHKQQPIKRETTRGVTKEVTQELLRPNRQGGEKEEQEEEEQKEEVQEVVWDEQGMTWEVYGACVDLESLGGAIQSHLQSRIREQEHRIRTLRKSVSSESSAGRRKKRRRRRRNVFRRVFRPCCRRTSVSA
ncbi:G protein-regulated inducer of neurite outgrowth 3-like [Osmerus eperlanus]|uniref:G protein-regulated inducer of neurite outgrowth 3-like n=1 Tax=Osmerus eperlanus TaxID=29151 RepID=UPI002E15045C